jgi:hypothetical protein
VPAVRSRSLSAAGQRRGFTSKIVWITRITSAIRDAASGADPASFCADAGAVRPHMTAARPCNSSDLTPLTRFGGEIELAPVRLECPASRRRIREQRTVRQRAQIAPTFAT